MTVRSRNTIIWLALMGATIGSFAISHDVGWHLGSRALAITAIAITIAKVRYVGLDFMDLRRAPTAFRVLFEVWIVTLGLLLSAIYCFPL